MQEIKSRLFFLLSVSVRAFGHATQIAGIFPEFHILTNSDQPTHRFYRVHERRIGQADSAAILREKRK